MFFLQICEWKKYKIIKNPHQTVIIFPNLFCANHKHSALKLTYLETCLNSMLNKSSRTNNRVNSILNGKNDNIKTPSIDSENKLKLRLDIKDLK